MDLLWRYKHMWLCSSLPVVMATRNAPWGSCHGNCEDVPGVEPCGMVCMDHCYIWPVQCAYLLDDPCSDGLLQDYLCDIWIRDDPLGWSMWFRLIFPESWYWLRYFSQHSAQARLQQKAVCLNLCGWIVSPHPTALWSVYLDTVSTFLLEWPPN